MFLNRVRKDLNFGTRSDHDWGSRISIIINNDGYSQTNVMIQYQERPGADHGSVLFTFIHIRDPSTLK